MVVNFDARELSKIMPKFLLNERKADKYEQVFIPLRQ